MAAVLLGSLARLTGGAADGHPTGEEGAAGRESPVGVPADPVAITTEILRIEGPRSRAGSEDGWLAAELRMPALQVSPVPAVVLLTVLAGEEDLAVLDRFARDLAARGIAALSRPAPRAGSGVTKAPASPNGASGPPGGTLQDVLDSAAASVRALRHHPGIDSSGIYVLGYGAGGVVAPLIANQDAAVAGLALLGVPARPLSRWLAEGLRERLRAASSDSTRERVRSQLRLVALAIEGVAVPDSARIEGLPLGLVREIERQDPVGQAMRLRMPVFVGQGGRDTRSTIADFDLWKSSLKSARAVFYPRLDRGFRPGVGPELPGAIPSGATVAAEVARDLEEWIRSHR
jgi:hypothetical protein